MRTFWALYKKEWKDSQQLLGFLVVGITALELYGWYHFDPALIERKESAWYQIPFVIAMAVGFFAPAFLLARSFSFEWKSETHYQWFSLPVNRWITVMSKFAVALSQGIVLLLFSSGGVFQASSKDGGFTIWQVFFEKTEDLQLYQFSLFMIDIFVMFSLPVLLGLVLTLALVTAMEGVKFTVHRYRGLVALVFFGSSVYLFGRFFNSAVQILDFMGSYKPLLFLPGKGMGHSVEWASYAYPLLAIVLLMGMGLWLFEKRVDI